MLAVLYKQDGPKARRWPKQIRKLLCCNKSEYLIINGLIYYKNQVFISDSLELRLEIIHHMHSLSPVGNLGCVKTLDLLNQTYWWLGIL